MLVFSVYMVLSFFGPSSSTSITNSNYGDLNSHMKFINKVQEFLVSNNSYNLSPQCSSDYELYREGLRSGKKEDIWALRMFDAQSKIPSGLLDQNLADLGSFDECLTINVEIEQSRNIFGKYCLGTVLLDLGNARESRNQLSPLNSQTSSASSRQSLQALKWATCLPHTCSSVDMQEIYSDLGIIFSEELCQTQPSQPKLDDGSIVMIAFLLLMLVIVTASTLYDTMLCYSERKSRHPILIAFSGLTNCKKLIATSNSPSQISCLHGIRVLSTIWVILYHRYYVQFPMTNPLDYFEWVSNPSNVIISGGTLVVDTFFALSGIVVTYSFMSADAKGKRFNVIMYYVHRYLRLTPVLAIVVVVHITILRYLGSGPIWPQTVQTDLIDNCEKHLWRTFFYAQNYGDVDRPCVPQSWYLSVDMQLFVLSPLLLIPLTKKPKLTLCVTGFLALCSCIVSFVVCYVLEIYASSALSGDPEKTWDFFYILYYPTHTRAGPWLIGIIVGYFLFKLKQNKTKLTINRKVVVSLWIVTLAVLVGCLYAGHDPTFGEYKRFFHSLILALMRPVWAIGICSTIFLCVIGYGGPINWFLSMPLFEVLSKITYSQYLVHYTIIYMTSAQMRVTPKFGSENTFYVFWGDFAYTSGVAFVLAMTVELPVITIQNIIFGESKKKQSKAPLKEDHIESGRK